MLKIHITQFSNNGFAVAVAVYLLIRLEKQINNLSNSISKLNTIISTKLGIVINNDNPDKVA
ncbi:YvrJ family protein [Clostridium saccharoperbutylacetonicum]|uniref:YvrJ family protein n=1 Tax=Clostridium saccharoperbutylacetonicum TaxID=36745 RepID=UPI0009D9CC03|nr:YvrJ family protein [Clostridium saccharoperbutylacetonicum]